MRICSSDADRDSKKKKLDTISSEETSLGSNQITVHLLCLERRSPLIGRLLPADSGLGLFRTARFRRSLSFRLRVEGRDMLLSLTETEHNSLVVT